EKWAGSRAVVFREATSTSSWTVPATASMVTGLAVHQHGAYRYPASLPPAAKTLATYLRDAGYETHGLAEGAFLGPALGLDRGFDQYDWGGTAKEPDWKSIPEWVREHRRYGPFFLFLHTYLVHAPYPEAPDSEDARDPRVGWLARRAIDYEGVIDPYNQGKLDLGAQERDYISRQYDALAARADGLLGDLLEGLDRELGDDERLLIVTADHGEEIFEHERFGHGQSLYEELLRVPLIVRFPGKSGGRFSPVRDEPVSLLDLVPTALEAAGIPVPEHLPGLPLFGSLPGRRVRVAETHVHAAVRLGSLKLILGQWTDVRWTHAPEELYDLKTDPGERRNLAPEKPQTVRAMRGVLEHYRTLSLPGSATRPASRKVDGSELEEMRGLGYLGGPH
ncbi:MAG TPA: sulfatase, partial [Planctomycetota bacterium]|nr:sulfatase [Planctomycetota bacterium]